MHYIGVFIYFQYKLHDDACNAVSFHPHLPIIASTSGKFHFTNPLYGEEKSNPGSKTKQRECLYENALLFLLLGQNVSLENCIPELSL